MSKRFGRNQRRRAREVLAEQVKRTHLALEEAKDRLSMYHHERKQGEQMRQFFEQVALRVGEQAFIARGVNSIELDYPGQNKRAAVREEFDYSASMRTSAETHHMVVETLHHLETRVIRDHFRREMLFEAYIQGKSAGYCLSESLLRQASKEELMQLVWNSIAPQMAHHLSDALKRK